MKKIFKYGVICSLSFATLGAMTACESVLDEVIYSELGDQNAFVTGADALATVNGIYQPVTGLANRAFSMINDMPTDVGGMSGLNIETLNQNGLDLHEDVALIWRGSYNIITRSNIAVVNIEKIPVENFVTKEITEADAPIIKKRYIAEAKAMRAYAYLMLTDTYYKVPLITDPETIIDSKPALNTIDEVDVQIKKDLEEAIIDLPLNYGGAKSEMGRMTKGAAQGLLMRYHMRKAGRDRINGKDAKADWEAGLKYANIIINSGQYSLVNDLWEGLYNPKSDAALYNTEAIFTAKANANGIGNTAIGLTYTPWDYDMGWNLINVPLEFYWKFHKDDTRAHGGVVDKVKWGIFITDYPDVYNNVNQDVQKVVAKKMSDAGNMSIKEFKEGDKVIRTDENGACYTRKYSYANSGTYNYRCGNNFYILRLSDVYLCKAECINELSGPTQEAVDAVEIIRSRAFGDNAHGLTAAQKSSVETMRRAICDERAYELHSEGTRRQDLIRMGLWTTVMKEHFEDIKQTSRAREINADIKTPAEAPHDYSSQWKVYPYDLKEKDERMYFPIPKRETDNNPEYKNNRVF